MPHKELSREGFLIEQFSDMRSINRLARKLFDAYYIDIDHEKELSPMDRMILPNYYIDPQNPQHPSSYILAGSSSLNFIERLSYVYPYVHNKKFKYDLSAYQGILVNSQDLFEIIKDYRKTKLDPIVMEDDNNITAKKSIWLKEKDDGIKLPILNIPIKHKSDEDYYQIIYNLIYQQFYRYLPIYLKTQKINFIKIDQNIITDLLECKRVSIHTEEGDRIDLTKEIFPNLRKDVELFVGRVPNPAIDQFSEKWHYVLIDQFLSDDHVPYFITYTLIAAIQMD